MNPSAEAIVAIVDSFRRGLFDPRVPIDDPEAPLAEIAVAINSLGESLRLREDLYETTARVALSDLAKVDEICKIVERERLSERVRLQSTIRRLSLPVIEVWDRVHVAIIVGVLDTVHAARLTDELSRTVRDRRSRLAVVDLTAVEAMDSAVAEHVIGMSRVVGLLGAKIVVCGIRAQVAARMVSLGVDMKGIRTAPTVRAALAAHLSVGRAAA